MNESDENTLLASLEERLKKLINKYDEQKGIINSYIQREREWKSIKHGLNKEINELNDQILKLGIKESPDE